MIVNKQQLGEITGYSDQTLTEWQREGMPVLRKAAGRAGNQYDTAAIFEWYAARKAKTSGTENPRDRLSRLQGDHVELDLQRQRGELVPASEVEPAWSSMIVAARQALLSLPGRVVPMLAQCEHEDAMREVLRVEFEAVLRKLGADDEPGAAGDDGPSAGQMAATAAPDAIGVGGTLS